MTTEAAHDEHGEPQPPLEPLSPAAPIAPQEPVEHFHLTEPEDTNGVYVVLAAQVPSDGVAHLQGEPAAYREIGYYKASSPFYATKAALEDPATGLDASAREGFGVLLRAVPAMHWPGRVEATAYIQPPPPPPVLHMGRLRRRREDGEPGAGAEAPADGQ